MSDMESKIKDLAEALRALLWDSGLFANGFGTWRRRLGTQPSFQVQFRGWRERLTEGTRPQGPERCTLLFDVEVQVRVHEDEQAQHHLWAIVQRTRRLLKDAVDLQVGGVVSLRVTGASAEFLQEVSGANTYVTATINTEIDLFARW